MNNQALLWEASGLTMALTSRLTLTIVTLFTFAGSIIRVQIYRLSHYAYVVQWIAERHGRAISSPSTMQLSPRWQSTRRARSHYHVFNLFLISGRCISARLMTEEPGMTPFSHAQPSRRLLVNLRWAITCAWSLLGPTSTACFLL